METPTQYPPQSFPIASSYNGHLQNLIIVALAEKSIVVKASLIVNSNYLMLICNFGKWKNANGAKKK